MLDEIQAGIFDGWTYEQIEEQMPQEYAARKQDKLKYRYCALFHQLTTSLLVSYCKPAPCSQPALLLSWIFHNTAPLSYSPSFLCFADTQVGRVTWM